MSEAILKAMTNVGRSATVVCLQAACDAIGPEVWAKVQGRLAALESKGRKSADLCWLIDECVAGDDLVQAWFAPTGDGDDLECNPVLIVAVDDNGEMFDVFSQLVWCNSDDATDAILGVVTDCMGQFEENSVAAFIEARDDYLSQPAPELPEAQRRVARDVEGGVL